MADFDSLFVDNLAEFQPVMMQSQYGSRDTVGRARSSGSLERTGSGGSPSNSLTPPQISRSTPSAHTKRPASYPSHRRQLSSGAQPSSAPNTDPFSEIMSEFWAEQGGSPHGGDSPVPSESVGPPLHTDRLLSFRMHQPSNVMLLDAMGNPVNAKIAAQLHGMFFLAESPWDGAGNASTAPGGAVQLPKELTCYRRNLFQVSGSLSIPHISSLLLSEEGSDITADPLGAGKRRVIQSLEASISGIESVELSPVKIITVPWKSAAANAAQQNQQQPAPQSSSEDFPPMSNSGRPLEKEPIPISFDYPAAFYPAAGGIPPEEDEDSYKYPLNWKRLQFRSATANNGRRKDLQQHFLVKITIYATLLPENMAQTALEKLEKVAICEAYSGAIIVRGRSPRNFSSRNDIPLTGSAIVSSRHNSSTAVNSSTSSSAAKKARHHSSSSNLPYDDEQKPNMHQLNLEDPAYGIASTQSQDFMSIDNPGLLPMGGDLSFAGNLWGANGNWMDMGSTAAGLGVQPLQSQAALGMPYGFDATAYADIDPSHRLSLTGVLQSDDFNANQANFYSNQRMSNQENSMPPPSTRPSMPRIPSAQSPSMDLLYEYFPIGIDDWLPPVDVVYRPHAAHHQTQLPNKGNTRSKRLFSEVPFE